MTPLGPPIPAGAYWCDQFPTSRSTGSLEEPFQTNCEKFITALEAAGAKVSIAATRRPKERAYLMRGCWDIVNEGGEPGTILSIAGVNILWTRAGAAEMFRIYDLKYRPSLYSRHITGQAIDMKITWTGIISVVSPDGKSWTSLDWDQFEDRTTRLYAVGATYGVKKLVSDPPHWSDNGK